MALPELLVPIPDASTVLGSIGRTKTFELIAEGKLQSVKIGSRRFVLAESLRTYVAELAATADPKSAA